MSSLIPYTEQILKTFHFRNTSQNAFTGHLRDDSAYWVHRFA